jgi:pyruvate kinase
VSLNQTHLLAADDPTDRELAQLLGQLDDLLGRLDAAESTWADWLAAVDPGIAPVPET